MPNETIQIPVADGTTLPAYLARPAAGRARPAADLPARPPVTRRPG